MDEIQVWLRVFVKASFVRARTGLGFQPAVRIALDAGEAAVLGMIDEGFSRLQGVQTMGDKQALKSAGCPAEHCEKAAAFGFTPDQVQQLTAAGIDWSKLFALFQQLLPLILALFTKTDNSGPVVV